MPAVDHRQHLAHQYQHRHEGYWQGILPITTGPHAGGKGAKRVGIGLADMSRAHAEAVWVTAIVLLVILYTLWKSDAPAHVQESGRILLGVMVLQGMIGYTQYITHLPSLLVGIHVVGATAVVSTALWFHHGLSDHLPEEVDGSTPETSGADDTAASEPVRELA